MTVFRNKMIIKPIQTALFLLRATGVASEVPPTLYNLKTAHPLATKITHNNVLVIGDFWARLD